MPLLLLFVLPFSTVQFERVLLARSGVLLLTWSDPSGALARLRGSLHSSFPGACRKQSIIIHTSLFRIVGTPAVSDVGSEQPGQQQQQLLGEDEAAGAKLSAAAVANISAACEQWTQQVSSRVRQIVAPVCLPQCLHLQWRLKELSA